MEFSMNVLILQLLLLLYIREAVSQVPSNDQGRACSFSVNDPGVDCATVDILLSDDRVYQAIRYVESQGNLCSMDVDQSKIGPYHISEEYYNEAVCFDEDLRLNG